MFRQAEPSGNASDLYTGGEWLETIRNTGHPDVTHGFTQHLQTNIGIVHKITQGPLPYISFQIYFSLFIL
jgi:hypothetical protein